MGKDGLNAAADASIRQLERAIENFILVPYLLSNELVTTNSTTKTYFSGLSALVGGVYFSVFVGFVARRTADGPRGVASHVYSAGTYERPSKNLPTSYTLYPNSAPFFLRIFYRSQPERDAKKASQHKSAMVSACFVGLPLLIIFHSTNAFHYHPAMLTNQSHSLKDGSHNHHSLASKPTSSSRENDHDLRDGSHNHPALNTMHTIETRLAALNLTLPPPGGPKANYVCGRNVTTCCPNSISLL